MSILISGRSTCKDEKVFCLFVKIMEQSYMQKANKNNKWGITAFRAAIN